MRIRLPRIEFNRLAKIGYRILVLVLFREHYSTVDISQTNIASQLNSLIEIGSGPIAIAEFRLRITEVSPYLRVVPIVRQFGLEFGFRFLIVLRFPVEKTQSKVNVWLVRRNLRRLLELGDGFRRLSQAIQSFSNQQVCGRRVWLCHQ